jgi:hypothetical protein
MSNRYARRSQKPAHILAAGLLLFVMFAQVITAIPRNSITFDEDLHISTGYSVLRTGDLRLVEDHPPLIGLLTSWPLLLSPDVPDPREVPAWEQGDRRLFVRNELWWRLPIDEWVIPPRIPVAWLALVLGAFLYRWAADLFGPRAGLFALALLAFDPNILAHASLATLDLGVAVFIFITLYGVYRYLLHPNGTRLVFGGIALGLTLSSKISGVVTLPISVGLISLWGLTHWPKKLITRLAGFAMVTFLALWAVHLFSFGTPTGLAISLPAPTFWRSFLRVGRHAATGNRAFLLGETYQGGKWEYFPITFSLKTPLPVIILLVLALLVLWRSPKRWWRELMMVSLPAGYFFISMINQINLGYRHLLPILPFIYLFIARVASPDVKTYLAKRRNITIVWNTILTLLLLWQIVGTLRIWPFHLTFFNEIAGGPQNGYRYLADSNVDWGQGLKELQDYLAARGWDDARLSSYVFFIRPELYGIQAVPLPPLAGVPPTFPSRFNPAPGNYVISSSTLRGLKMIEEEMYNWFANREPDDVVGNAMLVYQVSEREPRPTWLAQCTVPATPLPPEAIVEGFGREDLRTLVLDCTQSWIYPDAGESSGWYVLHREAATNEDLFIQQQLAPARLSFQQKNAYEVPPLHVYEWDAQALTDQRQDQPMRASPIEWSPEQAQAEGVGVNAPVQMDGPLTFEGYDLSQNGRMITLLTYWRVEEDISRPFSLMAHLVNAAGHPVAVGDGLGIGTDQLRPGDLLVQRHTLPAPEDAASGRYWLQTGAYWLDTMARFPILVQGIPVGDRLLLASVDVE